MKRKMHSRITKIVADDHGQILPWMVLMNVLIIGVAGLSIDLGRTYVCYRQLQASTDAAALAGAYALGQPSSSQSSVTSEIALYAATAHGANGSGNLPSPTISTTFSCVTDSAMVAASCDASNTGYNVVRVTQTATVPTLFIQVLSLAGINAAKSLTLTATSSATMASGQNDQVNVAMVVDATASMNTNDTDASCGNTRIYCALQGVRTMLGLLAPCTSSTAKSTATCVPYDQVSLFTFPTIQANTAKYDTDCSGTAPTIIPYTTPAKGATWSAPTGTAGTYQLTGYVSDWTASNQVGGSLSSSSSLVNGVGGPTGSCAGMDSVGGDGTYYAGAIYAAQASLVAAKAAAPGSRNVMIILSDGDASAASGKIQNPPGTNVGHNGNTYPSLDDQCHQAITAAQYASASGTTVYTIAYGASSSGCSTDTGSLAISPCNAMMQMSSGYVSASNAPSFYSDATASQNKGQCTSPSNPNLTLNGIFGNISAQLTKPRLIPNSVT
ncbi:pilus assembly protein TadG-related protein [Telmatobacter sp. DSM 110680]|uniref:Pilus assembly protein TadG-related protein n=1 Tax=Telmatobacter sp. DSM 110680 TaxID=3036704 RepID=A0AAU7DIB8_9BACT